MTPQLRLQWPTMVNWEPRDGGGWYASDGHLQGVSVVVSKGSRQGRGKTKREWYGRATLAYWPWPVVIDVGPVATAEQASDDLEARIVYEVGRLCAVVGRSACL